MVISYFSYHCFGFKLPKAITFFAFKPEGAPSRAFDNQSSKLLAKVRIDCVREFGIGRKTYEKRQHTM